jgi:hypothetical protein
MDKNKLERIIEILIQAGKLLHENDSIGCAFRLGQTCETLAEEIRKIEEIEKDSNVKHSE